MNNNFGVTSLTSIETKQQVDINFFHVKKSLLILRALNHKLRQQMLKLLDEKQKITVTEIFQALHLEQSVASQHLAILRRAGIVATKRDGKFIYYFIRYDRLKEISAFVEALLK